MDKLEVRIYNVRFGDGILISVPDKNGNGDTITRHILIDVGNVRSGEGGENEIFTPVINDILNVLDGQPLDLYVLTHEHLDHAQGLLWAAKKEFPDEDLSAKLKIQRLWLPASAEPDYYDTHENAKKKFDDATKAYLGIEKFLAASPESVPELLKILLQNNNRFIKTAATADGLSHGTTSDCVEYIRQFVGSTNTHYVHRSIGMPSDSISLFDVAKAHNFQEATFEIWAPEEDTSEYYGHFRPMGLGVDTGVVGARDEAATFPRPKPPAGVDAGAFYNLVDLRTSGYVDNLLAIDKAANNSSIVFCLTWRGWRLLFTGDAEIRSWKEMNKENVLSPVHFVKISHHGSHNGTPNTKLLQKILPGSASNDGRERKAAVSTFLDTYGGIPDDETLREYENKHGCTIYNTLGLTDGVSLKIEFDG